MFTKLTLLVTAAILSSALIACDDDDVNDGDEPTHAASVTRPAATATVPAASTTTAAPDATPTPNDGLTAGLRTIVAAGRENDAAALEALVRYQPVPCTATIVGVGGPPLCGDGEAEGTPVDVVFATTCEGYHARSGELHFAQTAFGVHGNGDALYGVFAIDPASQLARTQEWAGARYAIVFNRMGPADQNFAYTILSDGEAIIGTAAGCGETPQEWVAFQGLAEPIFAP